MSVPKNETPEHREARLARQKKYNRERYANMTPEQKEAKLAEQRERRANMTPEQKEARLAEQRERYAKMTPEQREAYLTEHRKSDSKRRANMTPEQKEAKQAKDKAYNYRKNLSTLALLYAFEMMQEDCGTEAASEDEAAMKEAFELIGENYEAIQYGFRPGVLREVEVFRPCAYTCI